MMNQHPSIDIRHVKVAEFMEFSAKMEIPPTGVLEHTVDPRRFVNGSLFAELGAHLDSPKKVHLTEFSSIPLHVDVVVDGMTYAHLVLSGEFDLHLGDEVIHGEPGMLFVMDPSRPHTVVSKDRCVTLCIEMN